MNNIFSNKVSNLKPSAIREILKATSQPGVIPFAAGNPAPEAFPIEKIVEISNELLVENPILALQYSITEGYPPLIKFVKGLLFKKHYINDGDEVIITSGAQQGVELSCKTLCNEGDTIICEAPTFIGTLNAFRSYNVNLVGVPVDDDGINIDLLETALIKNPNTKFIYLIPNFQNPSGITMSREKREAVYSLAHKYDVFIVEDDPYGDLRFEGEDLPSIKALDKDDRVIYCGSFSKVLAPGLRVGYVCAPKEVISKITVCKQASDVHTNIWAQAICQRFFDRNDYFAHTEKLSEIYKKKCKLMLDNMKFELPTSINFVEPEGGLFIWATLPDECDMLEFCKAAVKNMVAVVPGTAFMVDETAPTNSFRLNFSTPTDEQIVEGVNILGKVARELIK